MHSDNRHHVYLSLGSNLGNRLEALQHAVKDLESAGRILARSSYYRTEARGFDGEEFLNMVLLLETGRDPESLLSVLQNLEQKAGREPGNGDGTYRNRPLDIDILTYDHLTLTSADLVIPHPQLARRRFVLEPWNEIAPDFRVPGYGKTVAELLAGLDDPGRVEKIGTLPDALPYRFLTIEGNIGAGKTTLARMMSRDFNGKLVLERFEENPFLPSFYEDPERYAFPLEMSFLADRYQQLTDELSRPDLFADTLISDYFIIKSLIFAGVTLTDDEYGLYRKIFNFMYRDLRKPDLYVYLYRTPEDLLRNIAKRGRDYERHITADYLHNVHNAYMNFIREQRDMPVLILDITGVDFVSRPEKYIEIVRAVTGRGERSEPIVQQKIEP